MLSSHRTHAVRRRLCWITPDYFTKFDAPIVPQLAKHYDIDWILVRTRNTVRDTDVVAGDGIRPRAFDLRYRQRDPRVLLRYLRLVMQIRAGKFDLVYTSFHGLPYFLLLVWLALDLDRVIYAVHNVTTPKGASNERAMKLYHRFIFRTFKRFQVFSPSQLQTIETLLPAKTNYYAPLVLPDYGETTAVPPDGTVRFLFFGYIRRYKRLDLLIRAFKTLKQAGAARIELHIAGDCDHWEEYLSLIGDTPDIEARIGIVRGEDVPDLVGSCHYLVLPYQDIAQSGVLTLAYRYARPVIASDLDGLKQYVADGATGYLFTSESEASLTAVMRDAIASHPAKYDQMKRNVEEYVAGEYSLSAVVAKYRQFLDHATGEGLRH